MSKNIFTELSEAMANAAEQAGRSTVLVDARRRFPASGIAMSGDLILTADHVVEREEDIKILTGEGKELSAKLAGRDTGTDLAVLKVDGGLTPAEVSKSAARVAQFVLAVGRPTSKGIESSFGMVNALGGPVRTGRGGMLESFIKTDVVSYPGFSGGPLVNGNGEVLGINTSGFGNGGAITIPADIAWKVGETLAKHGKIKRGYIGIRSQTVNVPDDAKKEIKREQATALLVVGIESDSPAAKGGLIVGDILLGVAGKPVEHHDELFAHLSGDVVGKSTPFEVLRGGNLQTIQIVVGER